MAPQTHSIAEKIGWQEACMHAWILLNKQPESCHARKEKKNIIILRRRVDAIVMLEIKVLQKRSVQALLIGIV